MKPPHSLGLVWGRVLTGPAAALERWLQMEFGSKDTWARPWQWVCGKSWLQDGRPAMPLLFCCLFPEGILLHPARLRQGVVSVC